MRLSLAKEVWLLQHDELMFESRSREVLYVVVKSVSNKITLSRESLRETKIKQNY